MITKNDVSELDIKLSKYYPYVFVCRYAEDMSPCKGLINFSCKTLEKAVERYKQLLELEYVYSEFKAFHVFPDGSIAEVRFELLAPPRGSEEE